MNNDKLLIFSWMSKQISSNIKNINSSTENEPPVIINNILTLEEKYKTALRFIKLTYIFIFDDTMTSHDEDEELLISFRKYISDNKKNLSIYKDEISNNSHAYLIINDSKTKDEYMFLLESKENKLEKISSSIDDEKIKLINTLQSIRSTKYTKIPSELNVIKYKHTGFFFVKKTNKIYTHEFKYFSTPYAISKNQHVVNNISHGLLKLKNSKLIIFNIKQNNDCNIMKDYYNFINKTKNVVVNGWFEEEKIILCISTHLNSDPHILIAVDIKFNPVEFDVERWNNTYNKYPFVNIDLL